VGYKEGAAGGRHSGTGDDAKPRASFAESAERASELLAVSGVKALADQLCPVIHRRLDVGPGGVGIEVAARSFLDGLADAFREIDVVLLGELGTVESDDLLVGFAVQPLEIHGRLADEGGVPRLGLGLGGTGTSLTDPEERHDASVTTDASGLLGTRSVMAMRSRNTSGPGASTTG